MHRWLISGAGTGLFVGLIVAGWLFPVTAGFLSGAAVAVVAYQLGAFAEATAWRKERRQMARDLLRMMTRHKRMIERARERAGGRT